VSIRDGKKVGNIYWALSNKNSLRSRKLFNYYLKGKLDG
jgi:hypothetical protein